MSTSDLSLSDSACSSEEEPVLVNDVRRGRRSVWTMASFRAPSTKAEADEEHQSTVHMLRKSLSRLLMPKDKGGPQEASPSGAVAPSASSGTQYTEELLDFPYPAASDADIEAYLDKMKRTVNSICPSDEMATQTQYIVQAIMQEPDEAARKCEAHQWAEYLARAGVERIQYSRSIAVLAHDVLKNIDPRTTGEIHWKLQDDLVRSAMNMFCSNWLKNVQTDSLNDADSGNNSMDEDCDRKLNSAAFIGDLFAVGILDYRHHYCELVEQLLKTLNSLGHCHALYLVLLHASAHIGMDLPRPWLRECRRTLVRQDAFCALFVEDDTAKRWFQETCKVIDALIKETGQCSIEASHRRDTDLSLRVLSELPRGL